MILNSDITEAIQAALIAAPSTYWRDIKITGDIANEGPELAYPLMGLTIEQLFTSQEVRLGIVPATVNPNLSEYGRRDPSLRTQNIIYIVVGRVFLETPDSKYKVATWEEEKKLMDFSDLLDIYFLENRELTVNGLDIAISEIEPTEPPELELEQRVFMKITSLMFEVSQCKD